MTETTTSQVTVLGLGPMGTALAAAFLAAGHRTTIWNRTPGRTAALAERGATPADTAAAAVAASPLVVACVRDYAALRTVLTGTGADWTGRTLANLGSGRPDEARALAAWAGAQRLGYLDGAILTPTPTIGTAAGTVLYSGPEESFAVHRPTLAALGGRPAYLDADPGRAAAYEMALLDLFATAVHGVAHSFALARAERIAPTDLAPYARGIGGLLPEMIDRAARQLQAGEFPGEVSTIGSAAATIRHVAETARAHELDTGALDAVRALVDRAVAAGHGGAGLGRLALSVPR
ncbi:6-phosphogluconate dehydrogenase [Actinocatenispora thailandica]|uniref:6-phosphogluconate dehydrogenase n=1 Tax=Actinocatenispora thailandica TaxID=227318 RepID=A0A7R7DPM7_9ACTN|nr:NAD(P)-binding domain-containing protein [Actinocatenispora thailandica]BCJ35565.1 6-phosphogluconate dehydrogenase [Actinocatenispora thailandica]